MKIIYQKHGLPSIDAKSKRRLDKLRARSSELTSLLISDGLGHVRYSELRDHLNNPHVQELLRVDDEVCNMYAQYERETGVKSFMGLS